MNLAIKLHLIADVHRYEHRIRTIEGTIIERQRERISDLEVHLGLQPEELGKVLRDRAVLRSQVDAGNATAKTACEPSGRTPETTANIEQMVAMPHIDKGGHVLSGFE